MNNSMKRLFTVRDHKGNQVTSFFCNKQDAKLVRDDMSVLNKQDYYITRGPDHIGPHGNNNPQRKSGE